MARSTRPYSPKLKFQVVLEALTGAFFSRFKTENRSLFLEAADLDELRTLVRERVDYYNRGRRHSALGYLAPICGGA